jgi:hypothetical protein
MNDCQLKQAAPKTSSALCHGAAEHLRAPGAHRSHYGVARRSAALTILSTP